MKEREKWNLLGIPKPYIWSFTYNPPLPPPPHTQKKISETTLFLTSFTLYTIKTVGKTCRYL